MALASNELGSAKGEVKGSEKVSAILKLQYELARLELIAKRLIGEELLSRGTRDSHFAEAWVFAVSGYDPNDVTKPHNPHKIPLKTSMGFALRMRQLSPHQEGRHIEVVRDVLMTQPANVTLLGSPYDIPPEGMLTGVLNRIRGKRPEGPR